MSRKINEKAARRNAELAEEFQNGNKAAAELLLKENNSLIERIALSIKTMDSAVEEDDLKQEAKIAAWNLLKTFNPKKGTLSVYLKYLPSEIKRNVEIIPERIRRNCAKINKVNEDFQEKHNRLPNNAEYQDILGMDQAQVKKSLDSGKVFFTKSLNQTSTDHDGCENYVYENLKDNRIHSPEEDFFTEQYLYDLKKALDLLSENEKYVITKRYNLDYKGEVGLREMGRQLNLAHQTVANIQKAAERKLRSYLENLSYESYTQRAA